MNTLFSLELATAKIVAFMRSNSALMLIFAFFATYITFTTSLVVADLIGKINAEFFNVLIENNIISQKSIKVISLFCGALISAVVEISGFVFAVRGAHFAGITFSFASSIVAFIKYATILNWDFSAMEIYTAGFISFSPIFIVWLISKNFSENSAAQTNVVKEYTQKSAELFKAAVSEISVKKLKI